jgi:hypothetical protein
VAQHHAHVCAEWAFKFGFFPRSSITQRIACGSGHLFRVFIAFVWFIIVNDVTAV